MNYKDYYRIQQDILTETVDEKELETFLKEVPISFVETRARNKNTAVFKILLTKYDKKYAKQFYEKAKNKLNNIVYLISDRPEFADVAKDILIPSPKFCYYTIEKRVELMLNEERVINIKFRKAITLVHSGLEELDNLVLYKPGIQTNKKCAVICSNRSIRNIHDITDISHRGYIIVPSGVRNFKEITNDSSLFCFAKDLDDYLYLLATSNFSSYNIAGLLYYNDLLRQNVETVLSVLIENYRQKDVIEILIGSQLQEYLAFL